VDIALWQITAVLYTTIQGYCKAHKSTLQCSLVNSYAVYGDKTAVKVTDTMVLRKNKV